MSRSPIELIGAVLDEVEGIRQTDKRSFLPRVLQIELRDALLPSGAPGTAGGTQLTDMDRLVGETISHVFDTNLRTGDVVIVCASGAYLALEAVNDGDDASIQVCGGWHSANKGIGTYLRPAEMVKVGAITRQQQADAERAEEIERAEKALARAKAQVSTAQALLDRLKGPGATPTGSAA